MSTWATSGATTDFQFIDPGDAGGNLTEAVSRSAASASFRYAVVGSDMTDMLVQCLMGIEPGVASAVANGPSGLIARWTDANNYLRLTVQVGFGIGTVSIVKVVSGTPTTLASAAISAAAATPIAGLGLALRLTVRASGAVIGEVLNGASLVAVTTLTGTDSALATGGALEDGKPGIIDSGDGSSTYERWYDYFAAFTPAPEDITVYANRDFQIPSHGRVVRANSDGTKYGKPSRWDGHRIKLPPGDSRLMVRLCRTDLVTGPYDEISHEATVEVFITPRYFAVPEAAS